MIVVNVRQGVQLRNVLKPDLTIEVDASVTHLLDLIVITWVYLEKRRRVESVRGWAVLQHSSSKGPSRLSNTQPH